MRIACLGWGSLVWGPEALPVAGRWYEDGPSLSVEFARQSDNGRMTLVVAEGMRSCRVLWAQLDVQSLDDARRVLSEREGPGVNFKRVAYWSRSSESRRPETAIVGPWAIEREIDAVVWTALGARFDGVNGRVPTADEVVAYLRTLDGVRRVNAEEYVREAPAQIRTPYRDAIEDALGWTPKNIVGWTWPGRSSK